jgi:hypothetical protein
MYAVAVLVAAGLIAMHNRRQRFILGAKKRADKARTRRIIRQGLQKRLGYKNRGEALRAGAQATRIFNVL